MLLFLQMVKWSTITRAALLHVLGVRLLNGPKLAFFMRVLEPQKEHVSITPLWTMGTHSPSFLEDYQCKPAIIKQNNCHAR